jgi:hypothetical protein
MVLLVDNSQYVKKRLQIWLKYYKKLYKNFMINLL